VALATLIGTETTIGLLEQKVLLLILLTMQANWEFMTGYFTHIMRTIQNGMLLQDSLLKLGTLLFCKQT
jgi:hypothetical protein